MGETSDTPHTHRFTLSEWDRLDDIRKALDAHGRRVGLPRQLGELSVRDGTTPEELDEFLEQQRKQDTEE